MIKLNLGKAVKASRKLMKAFKKENVFNSRTFNDVLDPAWCSGQKKAFFAKSRTTGKPVEVFVKRNSTEMNGATNYDYTIFDNNGNKIGSKNFVLKLDSNGNRMHYGVMENTPCGVSGLGVIEDAIQIETAIKNGIKSVPRVSEAKAVLYHTKMGFLPIPELTEVKSMDDVVDLLVVMMDNSPGIKKGNFKPIIIKKNGKYFLDVNATQAQACVSEIKKLLSKNGAYRLEDLKGMGVEMELSGEQLNVWKKKLANNSFLDRLG